ncbi:MAG: phage tail protein [Pseudomonadota bacterium]|nr:phage tail protein [Pseudomonadota bacterium]
MDKLNSLKQHLIDLVPGLKDNPDGIHIFADEGGIKADLESTLSFSYEWQTTIICEEFSGHPDDLFVPLLVWIQENQRDIKRDDIRFLLDPLDNGRADIRITFPTDQRVIVTNGETGYETSHPAEPVPAWSGEFPSLTTPSSTDNFDG